MTSMMSIVALFMLLFLTLNSNGLHNNKKWPKLWQMLKSQVSDVVALQEMHLTQHQEYAFSLFAQSYEYFFFHGSMQSAGVFLAIHRNWGFTVEDHLAVDLHVQVLDIRYNDLPLRIINVYAPTNIEKRKEVFQMLFMLVIKDSTIILGDFNSVQSQCDRLSSHTNATTNILNQLLSDFH